MPKKALIEKARKSPTFRRPAASLLTQHCIVLQDKGKQYKLPCLFCPAYKPSSYTHCLHLPLLHESADGEPEAVGKRKVVLED